MAKVTQIGRYAIELDGAELALMRTALRLVNNFGNVEDMDPARGLLADLADVDLVGVEE